MNWGEQTPQYLISAQSLFWCPEQEHHQQNEGTGIRLMGWDQIPSLYHMAPKYCPTSAPERNKTRHLTNFPEDFEHMTSMRNLEFFFQPFPGSKTPTVWKEASEP